MAFVFRNQKEQKIVCPTPGPGQYAEKTKKTPQRLYSAPFNQASARKLWVNNKNPGPGSYQVKQLLCQEVKIAENPYDNIVIYQAPKESCPFKSGTKRFQSSKQVSPGPGQYCGGMEVKAEKSFTEKTYSNPNRLKKYIRQLNKLASQNNGDGDDGLDCTEVVKRQNQVLTQEKKPLERQNPVFSSKVERQSLPRPQTSAGPGSYNIDACISLASSAKKQGLHKTSTKSFINTKGGHAEETKSLIGPGYYNIADNFANLCKKQTSQSQKALQFFGSKVKRFLHSNCSTTPGPAYYDPGCIKTTKNELKLKPKSTFGSSIPKQSQTGVIPGFAYKHYEQTAASTQSNLKIKLSQFQFKGQFSKRPAKKGFFGSTQERFKQPKLQIQAEYKPKLNCSQIFPENNARLSKQQKYTRLDLKKCTLSHKQNKFTQIKIVKSQQNIDLRPLCYDAEANTLAKVFKEKTQINAPFNSHSLRFEDNVKPYNLLNENSFSDKKVSPSQTNSAKGNKFSCITMLSKVPRFKEELPQTTIGPQTYNPNKWTKKEFNTLFM